MTLHIRSTLTAMSILAVMFGVVQDSHGQINNLIKGHASNDKLLDDFYKSRLYRPVWDQQRLQGLVQFIRRLDEHGLSPGLFKLDVWEPTWRGVGQGTSPENAASIDVSTTHLALYAIQALAYGFVDPSEVHPKWKLFPRDVSSSQFLTRALQQPPSRLANFLLTKVPPHDSRYQDMVKTLARYRQIQARGARTPLPDPGRPIGPGISYQDLDLLKSRLQEEGDLPITQPVKNRKKIFEQLTSDALKSFQFRHGVTPDGYIGPNTLVELNYPVQGRISSLIINLDRIRWMPRSYEKVEHVEVNIAEGALRVYNRNRRVTTMEVIVGVKGKHQTPVFHGDIKYLIFRPYWNVPTKIATEELVPQARKGDPVAYFDKNHYEIVSSYGASSDKTYPVTLENLDKVSAKRLLMRQRAGTHNSMGLVKFIFPNDNSVYLHDTTLDNQRLFQATDRDMSHGCVRVSRPNELASIVLQRNASEWNLNAVNNAMNDISNPNNKVNLNNTLPVYLMYWTAFIMGDGRVRFDQDIYGHDAVMKQIFGLR